MEYRSLLFFVRLTIASFRNGCHFYENVHVLKSIFCHFLDPVDCQYIESESSDAALLTVAYVMAAVCALCLLPITVLLIQASFKRRTSLTEAGPPSSQQIFTDTSQGEGYGVHTPNKP